MAVYHHQTKSKNGSTTKKSDYSRRVIVRISIPLVKKRSSLDAGQYAFPFEIQLPNDLPMSIRLITTHGGWCELIYKIKAKTTGRWRHETSEITIPVLAMPEPNSFPRLVSPITKTIRLCGCIPNGRIAFTANVDNTRVGVGENVTISLGCKNTSCVKIKSASVKLIQTIKWVAGWDYKQEIERTITKIKIPLDDQNRNIRDSHNLESGEMKDSLYSDLLEALIAGKNQGKLKVPDILTSYYGKYIEVSHALVIKLITPVFSPNLRTRINMLIVESKSETDEVYKFASPSTTPCPIGYNESEVIVSPVTAYSEESVSMCDVVAGATGKNFTGNPHDRYKYLTRSTAPSRLYLIENRNMSRSARMTPQNKLSDANWKPFFRDLQPKDFADFVKTVKLEFGQVDVAVKVASVINQFSCEYVVAVLHSSCEWLRIQLVRNLLPICVDVKMNSNSILDKLTKWEKLCTEKDFEYALT